MIQDEEFDLVDLPPERVDKLGFQPQKEILTNHILPYASELDEESTKFLEQVKINLGKAVMLREMKPACGMWTARLMKYIRIYGLKFSKEDHIALIKLAYELVLIPDLEPCRIHKFATVFVLLAKKRTLIAPDEMTLPWRPLYDLGNKIFNKSSTLVGMYHYQPSLEGSYLTMVKCAKPYFDINATKEILEEMLPQIGLWSNDTHLMGQLVVFLPNGLPTKYAAQGHELWLDKLMAIWDTCYNSQCGVTDLLVLFSSLAKRNPGAVNWTPYVPNMFARFLHALNLPVGYKDLQYCRNHCLDTKHVASWIVWSICPDGAVLKHLRSFLGGVESYLHSANAGRWSFKLRDLLRKLAREFLNRVRREREKRNKKGWENQTPKAYLLRDSDITEYVTIVLEPTLQAVYSRSGALDISNALQNLATLRPAIVVPPLLERLRTSLTSLTEPHRVTAAMSAVAAVARPMLRGPDHDYPEGPTHVIPILMAVLPGLDPNDIKKTLVSLQFILMFSGMVPFIDCSSAHEYWSDLTEEELLTCELTAQFEDFVLVFLDRLFIIIESSVMEHVRLETKDSDCMRSKTDAVMETAISSAATSVLIQSSPKIFQEAMRKFKAFATESTFETHVSGSMVGVLLRVFARIDSEATLAAFLPKLCEELQELLSTDEALHEENPSRDLMYRLVLFMHCVECDGVVLLKYMPQVLGVLDRALKLHSNYALTRACEGLIHVLNSLSYMDLREWRSSPKDFGAAPKEWLPIREWGRGCFLKDTNFKWHVPSVEEAECAQMLIDRYLKPEVQRLRQWLSGERPMCRERRLRSFHIITAALSCSSFLPAPNEEPIEFLESQVPPLHMPFVCGARHAVTLDGENIRVVMTKLMMQVQERMIADKTDDTKGLELLIQVWERIIILKGQRTGPGMEARIRSYSALERALDGRGGVAGGAAGAARLRMVHANAARLQDENRLDLVCDSRIVPSILNALNALFELSINTYSSVRMLAQVRLYWLLSHYPYSYRLLVPKLAELLSQGGEGDEWHARHKGALFIMLGPRAGPLIAKQDWEAIRTLWPAVLKTPLSEKPSIIRLEQAFSDTIHRHFTTVNTTLEMSDTAVEFAKSLLPESELQDPAFLSQLQQAVAREIATSEKSVRLYNELILDLVDVAEASNVQWRRLEIVMHMLSYCPLLQTPYPAKAVHLIVRSLLHDDITVRRAAQRLTHYAMKQRKRSVKKIAVDPYEVAGVEKPEVHIPGYRKDLEWTIWDEDKIPQTEEEWDAPWLRNPFLGFYSWPKKLEIIEPPMKQYDPSAIRPEDMEEGERHVYEFFSDDANIDKLVGFLTVEEKKGKDKFSGVRFIMFRMVFAQFGPRVANRLLEHALRCAADSQEALQRFAAEVAAAALRAPRYWPMQPAIEMYQKAADIINAGLTAVTPETMEDWGTCVATGVEKLEPRRGGVALQALMKLCTPPPAPRDQDPDHHTSFVVCARLYALQGALGSLTWRAAPLAAELLKRLDDANFIQHPYQSVREIVGSILMTLLDTELIFPGGNAGKAPRLAEFLASVQPRLAALYDENGDIVVKTATFVSASEQCAPRAAVPCAAAVRVPAGALGVPAVAHASGEPHVARLEPDAPQADYAAQSAEGGEGVAVGVGGGARATRRLVARPDGALLAAAAPASPAANDHARALNLFTTVLRGCMGVIVRSLNSRTEIMYEMFSTACALAARGPPQPHDELPRYAGGFLASLALAHHTPQAFDKALTVLEGLADGRSWWARLACLDFAQPLLFYGLPLLCDEPERAVRAERFALKLMRDARLEVRQLAAKLLTGLMHCRALPDEDSTLRSLMRSCRSKELVERHCGVLGLCSYLASRPYSLGPQLGSVLAELAKHTNAPDPIPATIRAALAEFRRTHQDDWPKHREQLTEEELDLLADLTSPPSYCA
ncbi:proteasome activator complex subunit 4-like isoform X2 [Epargyreus clarus]|uniref:proteasome activator complex subunit 4-like isoform X2 n=1 Tax=Epargyreus clarus TaxID=520877 RepID=UPI003C2C8D5D